MPPLPMWVFAYWYFRPERTEKVKLSMAVFRGSPHKLFPGANMNILLPHKLSPNRLTVLTLSLEPLSALWTEPSYLLKLSLFPTFPHS